MASGPALNFNIYTTKAKNMCGVHDSYHFISLKINLICSMQHNNRYYMREGKDKSNKKGNLGSYAYVPIYLYTSETSIDWTYYCKYLDIQDITIHLYHLVHWYMHATDLINGVWSRNCFQVKSITMATSSISNSY